MNVSISQEALESLLGVRDKAIQIVNFCYSQDGNWIGTENIRKSSEFLEMVANLRDALEGRQLDTESI